MLSVTASPLQSLLFMHLPRVWLTIYLSQLLLIPLDVIRPSDISAAFVQTQEVFGRLDVVFNNTGSGMIGEAESTADADTRALFEVNFWGIVGAVRFCWEVNPPGKCGILLQNSSISGFSAEHGLVQALSKHAVEGSKELLRKWNIKASPTLDSHHNLPADRSLALSTRSAFSSPGCSTPTSSPLPNFSPTYTESVTAALWDFYRGISTQGDPSKFAEMLYRSLSFFKSADQGATPRPCSSSSTCLATTSMHPVHQVMAKL
ncbi:hypothetical protein EV363DRAFT_1433848 [Boletus edulis]|nr:hypothetical protein EV363DRAFT_1433848 [Boletus edulis]